MRKVAPPDRSGQGTAADGRCERRYCRSAGVGTLLLTDGSIGHRLSSCFYDGVLSAENIFANILIILYDAPVFNRFFCYLSIFYVLRNNFVPIGYNIVGYDGTARTEKEF